MNDVIERLNNLINDNDNNDYLNKGDIELIVINVLDGLKTSGLISRYDINFNVLNGKYYFLSLSIFLNKFKIFKLNKSIYLSIGKTVNNPNDLVKWLVNFLDSEICKIKRKNLLSLWLEGLILNGKS